MGSGARMVGGGGGGQLYSTKSRPLNLMDIL